MAVISSIIAGITAIGSAIGSAISAVGSFLGTTLFTIGGGVVTSGAAAGTVTGGLTVTVGGALAGLGIAASSAVALGAMYSSARASEAMRNQQQAALQQLQESSSGQLEVNKTATQVSDKDNINRSLSSLRVPLANQQADKEMINNVYGVDTNLVASATQMQTGLNIVAA